MRGELLYWPVPAGGGDGQSVAPGIVKCHEWGFTFGFRLLF